MRKSLLWVVALCSVLTASVVFAASASEVSATQEKVWKQYLSPKEAAAFKTVQERSQKEREMQAKQTVSTDIGKDLAALRQGFEASAVSRFSDSLVVEPFEKDGVKGLWFKPKQANKERVLLYFHGGGYVVGSPKTAASITAYLAERAGILCFSLDYPLAPESPYPAGPENGLKSYQMLLDEGFKPADIVLGGDSAGGGMTLAVLQLIRAKGLPMPAGAYLISPWTNMTQSFATHESKRELDVAVTRDFLDQLGALYAKGHDLKDPLLSPAFADLSGLPPLLVHVGSHEVLLDDSLTVVRNAAVADVPVELKVWPGYFHVFQVFHEHFEGGHRALQDAADFFNQAIDGAWLRPVQTEK